ncbi:MAG: phospholipid-binding lipoprotein MlaA [Methyloprofundus sp.]|nr:MAG: phospholipid-binding lipoprotein MlaA [Methyloprofundus sp.]
MQFLSRTLGIISLTLILVACASTGDADKAVELNPDDPYESLNRDVYAFNEGVDTYISSPIITVYQWVFPNILQTGISNFFSNLTEPRTVLNDSLQGKEKQAGDDFERFVINTIFGLGGLINVANYAGIENHDEDFAQTLAVWGVPRGEYIVLPLLGPSSYRAIPSELVDAATNPVSYVSWPIQLVGLINSRSNAEQSLAFINEAAVDPYVFMRASYIQWRDYQINEGATSAEDLMMLDLDDDDEELDLLDDDLDIEL